MHLALMLFQNQIDPEQMRKIVMTFLAMLPVIILVGYVIIVVPFWFICKKAGLSPWLSLINVIPLGNLMLIYCARVRRLEGGSDCAIADGLSVSADTAAHLGFIDIERQNGHRPARPTCML